MRSTTFTDDYLRDNFIRLNGVVLGTDVKIYSFVNAYGCEIGDESRIGAFVEIQKNVKIGRRCKVSSHSFLCEGVIVEDNVFIGHGVMFTNDKFPRATNADGSTQSDADWEVVPDLHDFVTAIDAAFAELSAAGCPAEPVAVTRRAPRKRPGSERRQYTHGSSRQVRRR